MGQVVTFAQLPGRKIAAGISTAPITKGDTAEMAAEFVRIAPGQRWSGSVSRGSDCYLFALSGAARVSAGEESHPFPPQTFATVQEGVEFAIDNGGNAPAEVVMVLAPPQGQARALPGFKQRLAVAERAKTDVVDIPGQKKKRIYFVGDHGALSKRGHAMIVVYGKDTMTGLHHHPNAESMFVVLDGALQFTVNGKQVTVKPGQAAYFGVHDTHGLHTATGYDGASFLEFHIPAAFTTVKE